MDERAIQVQLGKSVIYLSAEDLEAKVAGKLRLRLKLRLNLRLSLNLGKKEAYLIPKTAIRSGAEIPLQWDL